MTQSRDMFTALELHVHFLRRSPNALFIWMSDWGQHRAALIVVLTEIGRTVEKSVLISQSRADHLLDGLLLSQVSPQTCTHTSGQAKGDSTS